MIEWLLDAVVFAFALAPLPATVANVYLWAAFIESGRIRNADGTVIDTQARSWILRAFAVGATIVNVPALFFGFLAIRRIAGAEALEWTPPFSALAALALEVVPIYFALEFRQRRGRRTRRSTDGK